MELPPTNLSPQQALESQHRLVLIGTEGEISLLHVRRMIEIDPPKRPFSGNITNATMLGDHHLAATWVEREIGIARMAVLDLRQPLEDGPDLPSLRHAKDSQKLDLHHVKGSLWSHILDSEPLAICEFQGNLVFCTLRRGIYCVDAESNEVWRRKELHWKGIEELIDGDIIVQLLAVDNSVWAFSLGGGWAELDGETGEILRKGVIRLGAKVERVWCANGECLLSLSHETVAKWSPENNTIEILNSNGPVNDAQWYDGRWLLTGWREDLIWGEDGLMSQPRLEIGLLLLQHPEYGFIVLDNRGQWTAFAHDII
ncbi:MAG: hypothetical protein VX627_06000 [Candidatus Thermoplasmatota archaeon]|nr:hypothetical protein [Candidatus Thermoplasmatota archaeon]